MNYWEKFGAIAFDQGQKALLTSCSLKNPNDQSKDPTIKCCFSFMIRRDDHKMYAARSLQFLGNQLTRTAVHALSWVTFYHKNQSSIKVF